MSSTVTNIPRRALVVAVIVALLATLAATTTTRSADAQDGWSLTIFHNNDGESKLLRDVEEGFPGVAAFGQFTITERNAATTDGVVLLTSGDNLLASPELAVSIEKGPPYYDAIALSELDYDAMAIGNHEFDFGPDPLADFIGGFSPPVPFLSANLDVSAEPALQALVDSGRIAKSTVITTGGEMVGVIGATTPELPNISSPRDVVVNAVLPAVQAEVAALTAAGVNKIILISHLQDLGEELALVPTLSGVDVVIAGGGDENLRNEGDTCVIEPEPAGPYPTVVADSDGVDVPVITVPGGYRCLGELVVNFDDAGMVTSWSGSSMLVPLDYPGNANIVRDVLVPLEAELAELSSNIIATSEVDLDGRRSTVRGMQANVGSLLADAFVWQAEQLAPEFGTPVPDFAVANGGGIRNDSIIPAGPFAEIDTFAIAPFPNFVSVLTVPRETVKNLFEQAYDNLPDIDGQFAQVSDDVSIFVDPNQPAREIDRDGDCSLIGNEGSRVRDLEIGGETIVADGQVVPGPDLVLATVDFLARGGDCYPLGDLEETTLGVSYQLALANYIVEGLGGVISAAEYPLNATDRINTEEFTGGTDGDDDGDGDGDGDDGTDGGGVPGGGDGPSFAG